MARRSKFSVLKNNTFSSKNYLVKSSGKIHKPHSIRQSNYNTNLSLHEPAGFLHVHHLSKILKRSIKIWSNGRVVRTIGKYVGKPNIHVEYNERKTNASPQVGHYTLRNKREPNVENAAHRNNCLFNVVASQTGIEANKLRRLVTTRIRKKIKNHLCKNKLIHSTSSSSIKDMLGGAIYSGKHPEDAEKVLDSSQNGKSHPHGKPGHPRGHASKLDATGPYDSVENYSRFGRKTGFLSRFDQDEAANLVLLTDTAEDTMELLNKNGKRSMQEVARVRADELGEEEEDIPEAQTWQDGKPVDEPKIIEKFVMVMKHYYEKYDDEDHEVFILTFYPII